MKAFSDVHARLRSMTTEVLVEGKSPWGAADYMTPDDFSNAALCHPQLIIMIDCLRWEATRMKMMDTGNPKAKVVVIVTDDLRPGADDSEHGQKPFYVGVDIRCKKSGDRYYLLKAGFAVGFQRIGIYCDDLHLHFGIGDMVETKHNFDPFVCWVRKCKP